jgi:hypothetical protein
MGQRERKHHARRDGAADEPNDVHDKIRRTLRLRRVMLGQLKFVWLEEFGE